MFGNLRLVATDKLSEYRANTELFLQLGNEGFAQAIREGSLRSAPSPYRAPWLLYHSWRQPRIQVDEQTARLVRDLMEGRPAGPEHAPIAEKIREMGWCDDHLPADVDELVKRTGDYFLAIQNEYELRRFLERVQARRPRVVVEIGTARGGMLFCFCQLAARDGMLVSIDLPGAPNCGGQTATEREVFASFGPPGQAIQFIPADSHLEATRGRLRDLLAGRPVDLLFIDGDHSYAGCMADFAMYREFVAPDGLIAFHDICTFPDQWEGGEVGVAWQELKARYGGEEIVDPTGVSTRELRPGEHWRWGIGLIEARRLGPAP
jgi:predicted O-methyltransferase YrrM